MSQPEKAGETLEERIAKIEERRAARRKPTPAELEQTVSDLEAIDLVETDLGEANVAVLIVPHTEGLPTRCAVRTPKPVELARYRSRVKPKREGKGEPDYTGAAEELAKVCMVYPDREAFGAMCDARPGLCVQAGLKALELASARNESEGKG